MTALSTRRWRVPAGAGILWRSWADEYIVYENASGDTHQLDQISALALKELQQKQASLPELNELVAAALSIESDSELSIYLDKVISNLHRLDLIEPAFD